MDRITSVSKLLTATGIRVRIFLVVRLSVADDCSKVSRAHNLVDIGRLGILDSFSYHQALALPSSVVVWRRG